MTVRQFLTEAVKQDEWLQAWADGILDRRSHRKSLLVRYADDTRPDWELESVRLDQPLERGDEIILTVACIGGGFRKSLGVII